MDVTLLSLSVPVVIVNLVEIVLLIRQLKCLTNFEKVMLSLAFADLLVGAVQALISLMKLSDVDTKGMKFNSLLLFTLAASFNHVNAITADRFLAVCYPIKHRLWNSTKTNVITISILWLANLVMLTPLFVADSMDYMRYILAILAVVYIGLMSFVYAFIVHRAMLSRRKFQGENNASTAQAKKELQLVMISVCIVVTFMACTLPLSISAFIYEELPQIVKALLISNSIFNPLIYFFWKYAERRSRRNQSSSS